MPTSEIDRGFLDRCYDLAIQGSRNTRPNPKVGCVITCDGKIIGEGYHMQYGGPHAEVNAFASISEQNRSNLSVATVYVSLAPCCHHGKTPPCTDLLIKAGVKRVVIAIDDPSDKVNQKSIQILKDNGIEVEVAEHNSKFEQLISEFRANNILQRPYVQLKLAKSKDGFIGQELEQIQLTNAVTNIYTHKLRDYTDAILVGTNTARIDNPSLTIRNHPGKQPQRIVLDRKGDLSPSLQLLSDDFPTIIISEHERNDLKKSKETIVLDFSSETFIKDLLNALYQEKVYHIMVEGGAKLIKSFIKENLWDEAVIITTDNILQTGTRAPNINGTILKKYTSDSDNVFIISNNNQ